MPLKICQNCHKGCLEENEYCPSCKTKLSDSNSNSPKSNNTEPVSNNENNTTLKMIISIIVIIGIIAVGYFSVGLFFPKTGNPTSITPTSLSDQLLKDNNLDFINLNATLNNSSVKIGDTASLWGKVWKKGNTVPPSVPILISIYSLANPITLVFQQTVASSSSDGNYKLDFIVDPKIFPPGMYAIIVDIPNMSYRTPSSKRNFKLWVKSF